MLSEMDSATMLGPRCALDRRFGFGGVGGFCDGRAGSTDNLLRGKCTLRGDRHAHRLARATEAGQRRQI